MQFRHLISAIRRHITLRLAIILAVAFAAGYTFKIGHSDLGISSDLGENFRHNAGADGPSAFADSKT